MLIDYVITSNDLGGVINADTLNEPFSVQLPAPSAAFNVTIKDATGNSSNNPIRIIRSSDSVLIDGEANDDIIKTNFGAVSYISDGANWFRISSLIPAVVPIALFGGGTTGTQTGILERVLFASLANATSFGNLTSATRQENAACSSSVRALWAGGGSNGSPSNIIDYVNFSTLVDAVDFGDLTVARNAPAGLSNSIRGIIAGGYNGGYVTTIDYVTIAATGNATSFGNLTVATAAKGYMGACASTTRGVFAGGNNGTTFQSTMEYITIATLSNSASFGSLSANKDWPAGASNAVRGLFNGGYTGVYINVIDFITIATLGNAADFGDLTVSRAYAGAAASSTRSLVAGGYSGSYSNVIDYTEINTLGNATDFGDLTVARYGIGGCSNAHGGLQ